MSGRITLHPLAAAGCEPFRPVGEDIGRLGHEMHAAKRDRPALVVRGGQRGELIAVAAQIAHRDDFILLIMMPENQEPRAHFLPDFLNPFGERFGRHRLIAGDVESRKMA